ncbi:MAG: hypothetical protein HFJ93_05195 [Muribaculaceae bacterium]|jgi:hypothetical protein|nr:hypothetical protein [Muribaculaceae bacterium]
MERFVLFIITVLLLVGCRTNKAVSQRPTAETDEQMADSVKYAQVKEAFINGEFVFRITRRMNKGHSDFAYDNRFKHKTDEATSPTECYIVVTGGKIFYNTGISNNFPNGSSGMLKDLKYSSVAKKKEIVLTASDDKFYKSIFMSLTGNSDMATAVLRDGKKSECIFYGYIEPLDQTAPLNLYEYY